MGFYIMELTVPYPRHGRVMMTDNWFSSLQAADALKKKGLDFVGTIRDKPYLPEPLSTMKIRVGESVAMYHYEQNVTLISHQAAKLNEYSSLPPFTTNLPLKKKVKADSQMFYNATKGGVDNFDQLCANTSCIRSTG